MSKRILKTPLEGSEVPIIAKAKFIRKGEPQMPIEVSLYLRPTPSGPALPSLDEMTKIPISQQKHLSEKEFEKLYGADPADVEKVKVFAREYGLSIKESSLAKRWVLLTGALKDMNDAFDIELAIYEYECNEFRGHKGPVYIPKELEGIVTGVFGFNDHPVACSHSHRPLPPLQPGLISSEEYYLRDIKFNIAPFFTPPQLAQAYNFPAGVTCEGQTIGLIQLGGGFVQEAIDKYFGMLNCISGCNLEVPHPKVLYCGGNNMPGEVWNLDIEVCGDTEVVGGIANGAGQVIYFGKEGGDEEGFLRAVCAAILDFENNPSIISISWGSKEQDFSQNLIDNMNHLFQIAATVRKITVCVATGDNGSSDCLNPVAGPGDDKRAHVDFPASSPWVLACGGTNLIVNNRTIINEVVWNDGRYLGATGGGVSDYFSCPPYQKLAGIQPKSVNDGHIGRGIPDVAANSSFKSGNFLMNSNGQWGFFGGTSASAPVWAALTALLNEKLGIQLGFLNCRLYKFMGLDAFNDIIEGNNINFPSVPGYYACYGWDACTGLGTPNGEKLYEAFDKELKKE
jgi:kumamolisin